MGVSKSICSSNVAGHARSQLAIPGPLAALMRSANTVRNDSEDNQLWPNTRVVKCKYYVSQKQNGFNNKIQWYSILLTFIFKFTARILWIKICVLSNLSNCEFSTWQYKNSGIDPFVDGQSAIIPSLG